MRKMTFTAATLLILTGCSSNGGFMGMGGEGGFLGFGGKSSNRDSTATGSTRTYDSESAQTRGPRTYEGGGVATGEPRAATPQSGSGVVAGDPRTREYDGGSVGTSGALTYAGTPYSESAIAARYRLMPLGERYWPPVYENQSFPAQEMWTD